MPSRPNALGGTNAPPLALVEGGALRSRALSRPARLSPGTGSSAEGGADGAELARGVAAPDAPRARAGPHPVTLAECGRVAARERGWPTLPPARLGDPGRGRRLHLLLAPG